MTVTLPTFATPADVARAKFQAEQERIRFAALALMHINHDLRGLVRLAIPRPEHYRRQSLLRAIVAGLRFRRWSFPDMPIKPRRARLVDPLAVAWTVLP